MHCQRIPLFSLSKTQPERPTDRAAATGLCQIAIICTDSWSGTTYLRIVIPL